MVYVGISEYKEGKQAYELWQLPSYYS